MVAIMSAAFMCSMCSSNGNIPVESNWKVEYVVSDGYEVVPPAEHNATMAFLKDSKIAGETGCNRFFGNFTINGENIKFDNMGSTRMMCPEMGFETAYLQAIANTASYNRCKGKLELKDINGNITVLLKEIEPVALEN